MAEKSIAAKLLIKPGKKVAVVNAPAGFVKSLGDSPAGATVSEMLASPVDFVVLFAQTSKDVDRLVPEALRALKPDDMLWVCYPKGTSKLRTDLNRDILWRQMGKFKMAGVNLVSLDNNWSAMRFRPADKVGK